MQLGISNVAIQFIADSNQTTILEAENLEYDYISVLQWLMCMP